MLGKKETLKRKWRGSNDEHIEVNGKLVDEADCAKTESHDLVASLRQGFAESSQDI